MVLKVPAEYDFKCNYLEHPEYCRRLADYGFLRQYESRRMGLKDKNEKQTDPIKAWGESNEGVWREGTIPLMLRMDRNFVPTVNTFKQPDFGGWEIRGRTGYWNELIIRPDDIWHRPQMALEKLRKNGLDNPIENMRPKMRMILVVGTFPEYYVKGWYWSHDVLRLRFHHNYWFTTKGRPNSYAWWIPQNELRAIDVDTFRREAQEYYEAKKSDGLTQTYLPLSTDEDPPHGI